VTITRTTGATFVGALTEEPILEPS